jgi:hypothetical protein
MAEKRMFSKQVISSDAFLDMPATVQVLYFHLSMMADDDGFIDSPRSVMRSIGAAKEDMDMLLKNKYIIFFQEEGVFVIRHWNVSNNIRSDRYKETKYKELKSRLFLDESGSYNILEQNQPGAEPQPNDNQPGAEPQPNDTIDQVSIDQISIDQDRLNKFSGSAEPPGKKPSSKQKPTKPPLRERAPVNDMEKVEKVYLLNWDTLYSRKQVETPDPILNWTQTRKQLKTHFEKLKPEQIIQAINNGMNDEWTLNKGYSLAIMLSASVLNRLINAVQKEPLVPANQQYKKSL